MLFSLVYFYLIKLKFVLLSPHFTYYLQLLLSRSDATP